MSIATNKVGILIAEIDSGGALRSAGDRVILGARNTKSEQEWIVRQKIAECSASITESVHAHGGIVAIRSAESIFATFANADSAFRAACHIQRAHHDEIRDAADQTNSAPLGLRLGLTYGKMQVDAGAISGEPLQVATQVATRANSGQVIAAESLVNALGDDVRGAVNSLGAASFDGFEADIEIFEVQWDTQVSPPPPPEPAYAETVEMVDAPPAPPQLNVSLRGKEITLDADHPSVTLRSGKQREPHARLEFRGSTFYLVNLRAAGTRIKADGTDEQLCLDEIELTGKGAISLSGEFTAGSSDLLQYKRTG